MILIVEGLPSSGHPGMFVSGEGVGEWLVPMVSTSHKEIAHARIG